MTPTDTADRTVGAIGTVKESVTIHAGINPALTNFHLCWPKENVGLMKNKRDSH